MMEPQVRYARTSDGVNVAYWAMGEGPAVLLTPPLAQSHLALEWQTPHLAEWYRRMAAQCTLIRWDERDSGLSDRGIDITVEGLAADIDAVTVAVGADVFDVIVSYSVESVCSYAGEHPDRVRRLVIVNPVNTNSQWGAIASLLERDFRAWTETNARVALGWAGRDDLATAYGGFLRASRTQDGYLRWLRYHAAIDVDRILDRIAAETLVIEIPRAGTGSSEARRMAAAVRGARYVLLPGDRNPAWYVNGRAIELIEEFLGLPGPGAHATVAAQSGTAIILFADIVDSTALTERMGDAAFRERARSLDEALRAAISGAGGTAIEGKLLGDGVLATFPAAAQAIDAALRCAAAGNDGGLPLHLGIHAGDVIHEQNNVYGGAVNIASRISALSAPGEVLVSRTVADLARTSAGVTFEDRGEHALKGVADPQRVYAVRVRT